MAHFAPYLIDVLNLPPTYRGKLGLGMFLISLITCKANSGAEKFILEHCLLQELKRFEDGQVLDINNQRYFVQARLKLTILDTAGLKGFLHLANPQKRKKLGKSTKGGEKKSKERSQYLKWIVSLYESLPPYIDKTDIGDSQLQDGDKTTIDLLDDFSTALASFINCGLNLVTTNEQEHGCYTTVPPVKEGICN